MSGFINPCQLYFFYYYRKKQRVSGGFEPSVVILIETFSLSVSKASHYTTLALTADSKLKYGMPPADP